MYVWRALSLHTSTQEKKKKRKKKENSRPVINTQERRRNRDVTTATGMLLHQARFLFKSRD